MAARPPSHRCSRSYYYTTTPDENSPLWLNISRYITSQQRRPTVIKTPPLSAGMSAVIGVLYGRLRWVWSCAPWKLSKRSDRFLLLLPPVPTSNSRMCVCENLTSFSLSKPTSSLCLRKRIIAPPWHAHQLLVCALHEASLTGYLRGHPAYTATTIVPKTSREVLYGSVVFFLGVSGKQIPLSETRMHIGFCHRGVKNDHSQPNQLLAYQGIDSTLLVA